MARGEDASDDVDRVVVFIDEANVFEDAQRAFPDDARVSGRIKPMRYGELLVRRQPLGTSRARVLWGVRVYTGSPSNSKDPRSYAAHRRQTAEWRRAGATVVSRPLQYLPGQPPRQKGVDVHIALDIVTMAIRREYDVGILASADTDLRPALELCRALPEGAPTLEVAAWRGEGYARRLTLSAGHLWCHFLTLDDYLAVADNRRYAAD